MKAPVHCLAIAVSLCLGFQSGFAATPDNLVANPSFEGGAGTDGIPNAWSASGSGEVKQRLDLDTGRDGQHCAKLACTAMGEDGPSAHAMICQVGKVSVRQGRWYKISFWAKGEGIKNGVVSVALTCTSPWENAGLEETFVAIPQWQRQEFLFRAKQDLPARTSRLQFWYKTTGTLYLDDVELVETQEQFERQPTLVMEGMKNFIPNASFECGPANWGSWHRESGGWGNHLYRLEGEIEPQGGKHGTQCLKVALGPDRSPVYYFDYYDAVRQPARQVLVANQGWFRATAGEKFTLSVYLHADQENTSGQLAVIYGEGNVQTKDVSVGKEWQRYEFPFAARKTAFFIGAGLNLGNSGREAGTIWVDAVQLERGEKATEFKPRHALESFIQSGVAGNIFTNPATGASLLVQSFNDTDTAQSLNGKLQISDFQDHPVANLSPALSVPPHAGTQLRVTGIPPERLGFFRANWVAGTSSNSLRCAQIIPHAEKDSPFGMNHAYPWQFMVELSHLAGIKWWRDWSVKWSVVEPTKGQWNFRVPDEQIQRVLDLKGNVQVLLPFPATLWSTSYRAETDPEPSRNSYERNRMPLAYASKSLADFSNYVARATRQYQGRVDAIHILNEPLFTTYSLPARKGYKIEDYLQHLEIAYHAIKSVNPQCQVVGGIGMGPEADWNRQFIEKGGLRWVDIFDMHMYSPPLPAESHAEPFEKLEQLMAKHGGPRPIWMTEMGCYADDDPPVLPAIVGDSAMNRCKWRSEQAAAEYLVKFTAVTFAHGMRKILLHAGTCGEINGQDGGGIFFEYGGAPRKMYTAIAALTRVLGVPEKFSAKVQKDGLWAFIFQRGNQGIAIAWCESGKEKNLRIPTSVKALDIMGNPLSGELRLTTSPVYLLGKPEALPACF